MSLKSVPGNEKVKAVLANYLALDRLPQALVLAGPAGAGKLELALNLAKAEACGEDGPDACDACRSCRAIDGGFYPDVMLFAPEGQVFRKIQVDALIEEARLKPLTGKRRFFILDGADLMNDSAANAFLKTLEEPGPANVFLLLAENPRLLLPTVRSRCQILTLLPLPRQMIEQSLREQGFTADKAALVSRIVQETHGGVEKLNWPELDEKRREAMHTLNALVRQKGVEDILLDLHDRSRSRDSFQQFFRETLGLLSSFMRDIMILLIDPTGDAVINLDYKDELMELSKHTTISRIFELLAGLEELRSDVDRYLNARLLSISLISGFARRENG